MRSESLLDSGLEDEYEFAQRWAEGGSWLANPEMGWDTPPHHRKASTHQSHAKDWRSGHISGDTSGARAEYVGAQAGWYKPTPWSQQATFGEEDDEDAVSGIYLIRGRQSGLIKVGWSKNVYSRLATMQTGSSEELELVDVLLSGRTMETVIHEQNSDLRVRGEWFKPEILDRLL